MAQSTAPSPVSTYRRPNTFDGKLEVKSIVGKVNPPTQKSNSVTTGANIDKKSFSNSVRKTLWGGTKRKIATLGVAGAAVAGTGYMLGRKKS
jgi:hypothetical protein